MRRGLPGAAAAAGLAAALCWFLLRQTPTGPAEGDRLQQPAGSAAVDVRPLAAGRRIRVGSFNIHGSRGLDGVRDLDRISASLDGLDFIALNEVHGGLWNGGPDQAEQLGRKLGAPWLFAPSEETVFGPHFGSAILTALPVRRWRRVPFQRSSGTGYRNRLNTEIPISGGALTIIVTHIDRRDDRDAHLRIVFDEFRALPEPVLLMGDLNSPADHPEIAALRRAAGVVECVGRHADPDDPNRIDWIFARGLRCTAAGFVASGASDHPLVWADLQLP